MLPPFLKSYGMHSLWKLKLWRAVLYTCLRTCGLTRSSRRTKGALEPTLESVCRSLLVSYCRIADRFLMIKLALWIFLGFEERYYCVACLTSAKAGSAKMTMRMKWGIMSSEGTGMGKCAKAGSHVVRIGIASSRLEV